MAVVSANDGRVSLRGRLWLLGVAGIVGSVVGFTLGGHSAAFDLRLKLFVLIAATVFSALVVRKEPETKWWLAPVEMAIVVSFVVQGLHLLSVVGAALALVAWATLLVACVLRRRRLALLCVAVCAVTVAVSLLT